MVLDTNIVIYAAAAGEERLWRWLGDPHAEISVVTRIEALGFWRIAADEERTLTASLGALIEVEVVRSIAERAITLRQERRMGLADAVIAATALEHDVPLVTRTTSDFQHIEGLRLINPFG